MRNLARTGVIAAVLLTSIVASGCVFNDDGPGLRPQRLSAVASKPRKHGRVAHLAKPGVSKPRKDVVPGNRLRQFCDQRHIRFQSGALDEKPGEMAANNELCKQIYETGSITQPAVAADAAK